MNTDFRIKIGFHRHPKFQKLRKELGAEGVLSVLILWGFVALNRPDGNLAGMSVEEIELAAEWEGERGKFVSTIHSLRLLDKSRRSYAVHDWPEHNPYAAASPFRTERARKASNTRWRGHAPSIPEQSSEHPQALPGASSGNAPSPVPVPSPDPDPKSKKPNMGSFREAKAGDDGSSSDKGNGEFAMKERGYIDDIEVTSIQRNVLDTWEERFGRPSKTDRLAAAKAITEMVRGLDEWNEEDLIAAVEWYSEQHPSHPMPPSEFFDPGCFPEMARRAGVEVT